MPSCSVWPKVFMVIWKKICLTYLVWNYMTDMTTHHSTHTFSSKGYVPSWWHQQQTLCPWWNHKWERLKDQYRNSLFQARRLGEGLDQSKAVSCSGLTAEQPMASLGLPWLHPPECFMSEACDDACALALQPLMISELASANGMVHTHTHPPLPPPPLHTHTHTPSTHTTEWGRISHPTAVILYYSLLLIVCALAGRGE